jgi:beta-lactamase class A
VIARGVPLLLQNALRRSARGACSAVAAVVAMLASIGPAAAQSPPPADWTAKLKRDLAAIDRQQRARLGVHVRDLDTGASVSHRADQRWYLASMVKVPIAIAVMRGVEQGQYGLDTRLTLRASDLVDGAGTTQLAPVGSSLAIRTLLEQMIVHSDNTATDMLIGLVGLAEVNALVRSLVPEGLQRITTLGEVRRLVYGNLVPGVERLTGNDLLLLRHARSDAERLQILHQLVDVPEARRLVPTVDAAYDAYYASGLNSGRLDAYADLLAMLADGKALSASSTEYLLGVMERVATGTHRLMAGLPKTARLAHKTGTQRRRVCDGGLVRWREAGGERRAVVVACTRDEASLERAEWTLMQVGLALCRSGLMTSGVADASSCPAPPALSLRQPGAVPASPRR